MFATHPQMARRWAAHTPKGKKLPKRVGESGGADQYSTVTWEDMPWTKTWAPNERPPDEDHMTFDEAASFEGGDPVDGPLPGGSDGCSLAEIFGMSCDDEPRENETEHDPEEIGDLARVIRIGFGTKSGAGRA